MRIIMKDLIPKNSLFSVAVVIIFTGIILRIAGLGFISLDMKDFVISWYDQLFHDGFSALGTDFSNYTPPYLYLLWLATWTRSWIPEVIAIKLISILFDVGNAILVFKILKIEYHENIVPLLGAAVFFTLPTIILNSAWWGQADSIYTFFVLASLYFLLLDNPFAAMIFFGIAFSFKLQAVFITPLLFLLVLKRRIKWIYALLVPLSYSLMMIPAAIAGRPFTNLLTIYLDQADTFHKLTKKAPNLYQFISNDWYHPALIIGVGLTFILTLVWIIWYARKIKSLMPNTIIICAAVSTAMIPFFLPKMHERYFYLSDVILLLLAFYTPRLWLLPYLSQLISTITYSIYLFSTNGPRNNPDSTGSPLLIFAALINTILIGLLFCEQYKMISFQSASLPEKQSRQM